jgi:hypothetical protein
MPIDACQFYYECRGCKTRAVIEGLKSSKIGYLGLDVYEQEGDLFFQDLSDQVLQDAVFGRLLTFPNVLITGHQGFLPLKHCLALRKPSAKHRRIRAGRHMPERSDCQIAAGRLAVVRPFSLSTQPCRVQYHQKQTRRQGDLRPGRSATSAGSKHPALV